MLSAHTLELDQGAAPRQPFRYPLQRSFVEPDWTRLPGYREVTAAEWESALWQSRHTVKNLRELKQVLGQWLPRSEEHTSELQSHLNLVCRLLLEKKKKYHTTSSTQ